MFIYTPDQDLNLLEVCRGSITGRLPRLREALAAQDESSVQKHARELRNALGRLRVPVLFQLSQEIETECETHNRTAWSQRGQKFCDMLECTQHALEQTVAMG